MRDSVPGTPGIPSKEPEIFSWEEEAKTEYEYRVEPVLLKNFGKKGRHVQYFVRNLTDSELARIDISSQLSPEQLASYMDVLFSAFGTDPDKKKEALEIIFPNAVEEPREVSPGLIRKYKMLQIGSAGANALSQDHDGYTKARHFYRDHPIDADVLIVKIEELTGLGMIAKKKP